MLCLTTLFDGEGTLKDVYIATCYALTPLPLFVIPMTIVSNFVTADEMSLVSMFLTLAYVWTKIKGADTLREDSNIIRYRIEDCVGKSIEKPIDNACYLGHVITRDCDGYGARMFAETALRRLEIEFEETERVHEAI